MMKVAFWTAVAVIVLMTAPWIAVIFGMVGLIIYWPRKR